MRNKDLTMERYTRQPLPTARDIAAVLFRRRWGMLAAFVIVVTAVLLSGVWVPKYDAKMKILVQRQRWDTKITTSANAPAEFISDQVSEEDLNSEVELLNSEDLLRKVVLATGLVGKSGSHTDRDSEIQIANAVGKLSGDLKIEPLKKSNVISVKYSNRDPQSAGRVLRALAAAYIDKHLELHRSSGEFTFFNQQTEQYQRGRDEAQTKLTDFTKKTGIVSAQLERDSALQQANEFGAIAHQAQTTMTETEQRVRALQTQLQSMQPRMATVVRTSDNPQLLGQLKSTLLNLELKRTELLTKFKPTHRLVQEVDRQIADAKSAIDSEQSKPIREESSDRDPNYQWVQSELTKAQADLSGLKGRATTAASIARQYHEAAQRLDRDGLVQQDLLQAARTEEENYLLYVHKREEARISGALDQRGILNVAMAEQPVVSPVPSRSPLTVALLTLFLGGTFGLSTAFALDFMDRSFHTPDQVTAILGIPVVVAVPKRIA
jgi:protein tyrosine kinase modulator